MQSSFRFRTGPWIVLAAAAGIAVGCSQSSAPAGGGGGDSAASGDGGGVATGDGGGAGDDGATQRDSGSTVPVVRQVAGVTVTTFVGSGIAGGHDGNGAQAELSNPVGVTFDAQGNLLVTEWDGNRVRKVTPSADVTTVSAAPVLHGPFALALTTPGMLIVQTDYDANGDKSDTSGTLWNIGAAGTATQIVGGLGRARGLAALGDGSVAVVDRTTHIVHILNPTTAQMTTLAGSPGNPGFADGVGGAARFNMPYGAARFPDGAILVGDLMNRRLRRIEMNGTVTTFAGNGTQGMVDGPRLSAELDDVRSISIDAHGNVYFTDVGNHRIRRINAAGDVETLAGDGTAGFQDGTGESARFYGQEGLVVSADGRTLYVADGTGGDNVPYNRVRKIALP